MVCSEPLLNFFQEWTSMAVKPPLVANPPPRLAIVWLLPTVLSTTAGAVDVIGFLALGGLFTAHITGNLVVLAAHYITGRFGEIAPLLSVPMFVVVLGVVTLTFVAKPIRFVRRALLVLQAVMLAAFLGFGA